MWLRKSHGDSSAPMEHPSVPGFRKNGFFSAT